MADFPGRAALPFALAVHGLASAAVAGDAPVRVVLIGDSYISSYGIASTDKYEVKLQEALTSAGLPVQVVGTGYTATTYEGVRALKEFLEDERVLGGTGPKVVILELGSNDCGLYTVPQTRANLETILTELDEQNIPTLVAGTIAYEFCERDDRPNYKATYFQMFADLAAEYDALYYPDFKDGVGDHPDLLQSDSDHPTATGDAVIVERMLPMVVELVKQAQPS